MLLLGPDFKAQSPEQFYEYVKSLRRVAESKGSKSVQDITISFGAKVIVRLRRDEKYLTTAEVKLLAAEYERSIDELLAIFKKRKIQIRGNFADTTGETAQTQTAKADAEPGAPELGQVLCAS